MTSRELFENIKKKQSFLCVGLDSDLNKIPEFLLAKEDPIFEFNKRIVDATVPYAVAFKPNLAFYEVLGSQGWISLQRIVKYIKENYPDIFLIADAKRGDIGNTSKMYAKVFFKHFQFDAVTLSPYMGQDTVTPFIGNEGKWVILLALTSNDSAAELQMLPVGDGSQRLFEKVIDASMHWGSENNLMYVVGATKANMLADVRKLVPHHFLLIPGVGEQGGSLQEVVQYGMNSQCGLLVNSSRAIIYADRTQKFAEVAGQKAKELQMQMAGFLKTSNLL
ncbi:orotidine-5'-phosphate decarboxylase [Williamwhitmania taraxaci]|uniref:Orotidine-5'-phosphate decarboxylase n=1 Tax=Williamwhitmania taraxaci TaxID=1640674 RepID=A0A1G6IU63_9BACT|nr:orotidine-5'-phosphate decarboxylase [Williamwhitmania taraxaci]SDC10039.1 orotidine-5'-phosphate decarboxylase [Williamwhitmania taraxaci]